MSGLKENRCTVCGGTLKDFGKYLKCTSCDAEFAIDEGLSQEELDKRYIRMNRLENAEHNLEISPPQFDNAETDFQLITEQYPDWSAGYWGLLRAKFGIKFERDSDGKAVPSCYKSEYADFRDIEEYKKAIALAETPELKSSYQRMAEYIAKVAKEWSEEASRYDYDVFISFKASNDDDTETADSREMQNLYTYLTENGYKVFFSPVTLRTEGYSGRRSEPYIFNALDKAKVLIVYGSRKEYFTSTWVQNEWQRYLRNMEKGKKPKNSLLVVYQGINPKSLPQGLRNIQAIDYNSRTSYNEILNAVNGIFERINEEDVTPPIERIHIQTGQVGKKVATVGERIATVELGAAALKKKKANPLLPVKMRELGTGASKSSAGRDNFETGKNLLQNEAYEEAVKFFDKCLVQNGKNGDAWLGKLCAQLKDASLYNEIGSGVFTERQTLDFKDYSVLQNAIDYAHDKNTAENILKFVYMQLERRLTGTEAHTSDMYVVYKLYAMCADYNSVNVTNMHSLLAKNISRVAASGQAELVDLILTRFTDAESLLGVLKKVINSYLKVGNFTLAMKYNERAASLDETDWNIVLNSLYIYNECRNKSEFIKYAYKIKKLSVLQESITKLPKADAENIIKILCEAENNLLAESDFDVAERFFVFITQYNFEGRDSFLSAHASYFSAMAYAGCVGFFEIILKVFPDRSADFHIDARLKFADACREKGDFKNAEDMYSSVLNLEDGNSKALQGILFCRLKITDISKGEPDWSMWDNVLFEKVLSSLPSQNAQADFVNKMCRLCINSIKAEANQ